MSSIVGALAAVNEILRWASLAQVSFTNARDVLRTAGVDEDAYKAAIADHRTFDDFHGANPQGGHVEPPPPTPPAASIYDAPPVKYGDESDIPNDAVLKSQGFIPGDDVGIAKPSTGSRTWKVFRGTDRDQTVEIGQELPQDPRRFTLYRTIT